MQYVWDVINMIQKSTIYTYRTLSINCRLSGTSQQTMVPSDCCELSFVHNARKVYVRTECLAMVCLGQDVYVINQCGTKKYRMYGTLSVVVRF